MNGRSLALPIPWIEPGDPLPDPHRALTDPAGLLAAGRDLGPQRLIEAYRQGIFPWFSEGQPVLWWSPDPRMVLHLDEFRITRSFAKVLRRVRSQGAWSIRSDTAFDSVMRACAHAPGRGPHATWITEDMIEAYGALHRLGFAHSVEVWCQGALVGGLYGVAMGRMFYGESMFSLVPEASKVALAGLVSTLRAAQFRVIDCQQNTEHLASLGAREIPRDRFRQLITDLTREPAPDWRALRFEVPQP